ncbi:MAG: hypothetical protein WDW36_003227 [Sanguina aurantia]
MTTAAGLSIYGEDYLAKYTSAFAPQPAPAAAAPPQPSASHQQQLLRAQPLHPGQQAAQKAATNGSAASLSGSSAFLLQQGRAALVTGSGPMALYQTGRESGHFRSDPRQRLTVTMLQELYSDLTREMVHASTPLPGTPHLKRSGLTMTGSIATEEMMTQPSAPPQHTWWGGICDLLAPADRAAAVPLAPPTHGLYMYGGVGTGKTMLMDLFVESAPSSFKVTRTHFHDFMLSVHSKLRTYSKHPDPLLKVADSIAAETHVLALDELFVTDVADAAIVNRLFTRLWESGLVLVATSNRPPDELYKGGLQRHLFLPFIEKLKTHCQAHDMASTTDYRKLAHTQRGLYFVGPERDAILPESFVALAHGSPIAPAEVEVMMGRHLHVPLASETSCMFDFQELCGKPVSAADYIALVSRFHTLALSGLPAFGASTKSEAYRFVTLIDILYEHKIRLLASAACAPVQLFESILSQSQAAASPGLLASLPDPLVDDNLAFSKDRTISRLIEMQSMEHMVTHARAHAPELLAALLEAQAKGLDFSEVGYA